MHPIAATIIATSLLILAGCEQKRDNDNTNLKELVIQHLRDEGFASDDSHFVIDTFDRREGTISITGVIKSGAAADDTLRIIRFWVELQRAESSWKPKTIVTRSGLGGF